MKFQINLRKTPKGYIATSPFMDLSIHAGIKAFGKSEDNAAQNLLNKWNRKVKDDREAIIKSMTENVTISNYTCTLEGINLTLTKKEKQDD